MSELIYSSATSKKYVVVMVLVLADKDDVEARRSLFLAALTDAATRMELAGNWSTVRMYGQFSPSPALLTTTIRSFVVETWTLPPGLLNLDQPEWVNVEGAGQYKLLAWVRR